MRLIPAPKYSGLQAIGLFVRYSLVQMQMCYQTSILLLFFFSLNKLLLLIKIFFLKSKDSFLPTMPEEVLSGEIKTELQRMEEIANKNHHTVTWYRKCQSFIVQYSFHQQSLYVFNVFSGCPNGHPYAVGDVSIAFQRNLLLIKILFF